MMVITLLGLVVSVALIVLVTLLANITLIIYGIKVHNKHFGDKGNEN